MLDVDVEPVVSLARAIVPSWARELAPSVPESRVVGLSDGACVVLESSRGTDAGVAMAVVPCASRLSPSSFRSCVAEVYALVREGLRECGFASPVRMWNFLPGIHDCMGHELDRYRVFNLGRYDAFAGWFGVGGPEAIVPVLPAASAVGHQGDFLVVTALGLKAPGSPVENPRQTPAFAYSTAHGPRPPCFARATVAQLPAGPRLLVSGTASIRGEDSVHAGSLPRQLAETIENIERLAQSVLGQERFELSGIESARVYFPRSSDRGLLASSLSARLPQTASVEFFPAWICRRELLVEIEATLAPSAC